MSDFSNDLSPAETERLAILMEEAAEVIKICGKILRHGYESRDPTDSDSPTNRTMLEKELGDVHAAVDLMVASEDVERINVLRRAPRKLQKLQRYTHHQEHMIHKALRQYPVGVL